MSEKKRKMRKQLNVLFATITLSGCTLFSRYFYIHLNLKMSKRYKIVLLTKIKRLEKKFNIFPLR